MTTFINITPTIAKLLRLLASDKPGEVIAAVRALQRVLKSAGLDLHDLANAIEFVPHRRALRIASTAAGDHDALEMIRCCYRHTDLLTTRELKFVRSISNWCREPTARQMQVLRSIYKQCLKVERAS
jgi:hypothetical protein